jgi:hypothetical protein
MSQKSVKFHIKNQDYFGTLATILSLFSEESKYIDANKRVFKNIKKDLIFLQKNYKIIKK